MITLLVIDDHPIVLEGIESVLSSHKYRVVKATAANEALIACSTNNDIDMIVCDLSLEQGTDGLDLIKQLRSDGFNKPAIVYTMHEELWNIASLMKADVEGIVLKGDDVKELLFAIARVAEGKRYRSATFDERRTEALQTQGILSSKDIEVLRMLSSGYSNREISGLMNLTEKSIEYHRSNILKKLCSKNMAEATRRAIRLGIITMLCGFMTLPVRASGPEAIDMGLSVLWADRNLGAYSPEDAGDFFAFGETETKDYYSWETYQHCDGDMFMFHDFGTDNISATVYDAAHMILGDGWRLPTTAELTELSMCHHETIFDDESASVVFTGANGASIKLPIPGYMSLGRIIYSSTNGVYWSANCETEEEEYDGMLMRFTAPLNLVLSPTVILPESYGNASLGCSIRPVKDRDNASVSESGFDNGEPMLIYNTSGVIVDSASLPGIYIFVYSDGTHRKIMR